MNMEQKFGLWAVAAGADEPIPVVSIDQLCERLTHVRDIAVPFDERLRRHLFWALGGCLLAVAGVLGLSQLFYGVAAFSFFEGVSLLSVLLLEMVTSVPGLVINVMALVVWGLGGLETDWYKTGHIYWHRAGMALVVIGAIDLLAFALTLVPLLVSVLAILLALCVAGIVLVGWSVLAALAR